MIHSPSRLCAILALAALPVLGTLAYLAMWASQRMTRRTEPQPAASET